MSKDSKDSKDSKYSQTVNGALATQRQGETAEVMVPKAAESMLSKPSKEDIAAAMMRDDLEFAPQVKSLECGDGIEGILEGEGGEVIFEGEDGKPDRAVKTWIIAHPAGTVRLSILSSAQLDAKLPPYVGSWVKIIRNEKDIKTRKGYKVGDYLVYGQKKKDGTARSWTKPSTPKTIEATATEGRPQLPPAPAVPGAPQDEDVA